MKTLIIAEKPSVAKDIVRALTTRYGRFNDRDTHFENGDYLVSSAVGHLVEICVSEENDPKKGRWNLKSLPVIPPQFDLRPADEKTKNRLNALVRLINQNDVGVLINACDAGREGELIFRLIVQYAGKKAEKKIIKRLWLQSLTTEAILEGFDSLRTDIEMKGLEDAARCRSEADWIVGINGTRAMTAFNSQGGGFFLTTVGRVQTPTLSIVVEREKKIEEHEPRLYAEAFGEFQCEAGVYEGKLFNPQWKKSNDSDDKADRYWDTMALVELTEGITTKSTSDIKEEYKPVSQGSPLLFDLTSLQREANSRFGFSAKTTLSIAQTLYEKYKALTYPRTDSRFLPEDYVSVAKKTFEMLTGNHSYSNHAKEAIEKNYIWPNKKIFNNAKVSDHFAIIPTTKPATGLEDIERKIYDLVVKRFMAVFFPAAEFLVGTRITKVGDLHFKSEGKVLKVPGWRAIYGAEVQEDGEGKQLIEVKPGESVDCVTFGIVENHTKPAPRYNEGTLLGAMESVSKQMTGTDTKEAMKDKGLGTPATRAAIIENLLGEKYMIRDGKEIIPTPKASQLMQLLNELKIQDLSSPELTGDWEHRLSMMEKGQLTRKEFMDDISKMVHSIVDKARSVDINSLKGDCAHLENAYCPKCQGNAPVVSKYRFFECSTGCGFKLPRIFAGHLFSNEEVTQLLQTYEIGPLTLRSRMGRDFTTKVQLKKEGDDYALGFPVNEKTEEDAIDTSTLTAVATCPCCKGTVYQLGSQYVCEKAIKKAEEATSCNFRISSVILKQSITVEQLNILCNDGKTDVLKGFVSSKTNKAFSAQLTWDKKANRTSFVFEPREHKKKK